MHAVIVQEVGKSTMHLGALEVGDHILDVSGPLGMPTAIRKYGTVVCIAGGVGAATVIWAMGEGKKAALGIHNYITNKS